MTPFEGMTGKEVIQNGIIFIGLGTLAVIAVRAVVSVIRDAWHKRQTRAETAAERFEDDPWREIVRFNIAHRAHNRLAVMEKKNAESSYTKD